MRVALDRHELGDAHGARGRHAADVVAQEVDEHEVLRALLGVAGQFARPGEIRRLVRAARARARDRPGSDAPGVDRDEQLRRAARERGARQPREPHVGRRVAGAHGLVGRERIDRRDFEPRREVDLVGVARGDVSLRTFHGPHERGLVEGRAPRRGRCGRRGTDGRSRGRRGAEPIRGEGLRPRARGAVRGRAAARREDDDGQAPGRGVMHQGLGRVEQGEQRHLRVGGGRGHRLELRRELVREHGDEAALERGPARETRGAHLAGPTAQVSQGAFGLLLVGARFVGDDDPATRVEGQGAGGVRDDDREAARAAAFQDRMVSAGQEGRPAGRQGRRRIGGAVREVRPALAGRRPIGDGRLGEDLGDGAHLGRFKR